MLSWAATGPGAQDTLTSHTTADPDVTTRWRSELGAASGSVCALSRTQSDFAADRIAGFVVISLSSMKRASRERSTGCESLNLPRPHSVESHGISTAQVIEAQSGSLEEGDGALGPRPVWVVEVKISQTFCAPGQRRQAVRSSSSSGRSCWMTACNLDRSRLSNLRGEVRHAH